LTHSRRRLCTAAVKKTVFARAGSDPLALLAEELLTLSRVFHEPFCTTSQPILVLIEKMRNAGGERSAWFDQE
jgi:hypothetical protein